jgi:hypothetical protein
MGAMGAAIAQAKEKQEPYGVLLTTTAGKKDDRDGRYVYNYCQEAALWSELFFDCEDAEAFETMVRRNSRSAKDSKRGVFRIYGSFTHTQLGKTDDWLRDQLERTASTPEQANRDFFNIWTSGTESSPLKTSVLELLNRSIVEPKHQQISSIGGYITRWYIDEQDISRYMATKKSVIGIDTSDASGGDDISFVLTDVETGGLVAIGTYNETNLIKFAQWLLAWLVEYDNCTMVIERRSTGATIIDYLLMFLPQKGIDPFKRLFNWVVQDHVENKDKYEQALLPLGRRPEDLYVMTKKSFGFATSGGGQTSRTELYSTTLQNATRRCAAYVRDRSLTDQITGLVSRNGRIDHDVGGHDDLVIGWLLTHWFLTMGKNLAHYGIDSSTILSARAYVENQTPSEIYFSNLQQSIRSQIKELFVIMKNEENSDMHYKHEQKLRNLNAQLVLKDGEFFSIDAMLAQIKADKTKPVSKQSYVRVPINPNYVRMN